MDNMKLLSNLIKKLHMIPDEEEAQKKEGVSVVEIKAMGADKPEEKMEAIVKGEEPDGDEGDDEDEGLDLIASEEAPLPEEDDSWKKNPRLQKLTKR
jgi:hypothetical protein